MVHTCQSFEIGTHGLGTGNPVKICLENMYFSEVVQKETEICLLPAPCADITMGPHPAQLCSFHACCALRVPCFVLQKTPSRPQDLSKLDPADRRRKTAKQCVMEGSGTQ